MQHLQLKRPGMNTSEVAKALEVSRSGYCSHRHKALRKRRVQDAALAAKIKQTFAANHSMYGSPRIMHALRHQGLRHGKNRSPGSCARKAAKCTRNAATCRAPPLPTKTLRWLPTSRSLSLASLTAIFTRASGS
jgi:hypothetical protein